MNAREHEQADEAARRRHQDVSEAVTEAIGELLYRRSRRAAKPEDKLADLRIDPRDYELLSNLVFQTFSNDGIDGVEGLIRNAEEPLIGNGPYETVDQLATAIEDVLKDYLP